MSKWSHIVGTVYIDTFRELDRKDLQEHIEGIIASAPQVTGSEENAQVFVNVLNGYNTVISEPEVGIEEEYQTNAVITIVGDLRDRDRFETVAEARTFLEYLKKSSYTHILMYSIAVEDDSGYKIQL